jgi:hypothetical protein
MDYKQRVAAALKWGLGTMQIVAILLAVQESYGLGVEAVKKPFRRRLGTPVPLAVR